MTLKTNKNCLIFFLRLFVSRCDSFFCPTIWRARLQFGCVYLIVLSLPKNENPKNRQNLCPKWKFPFFYDDTRTTAQTKRPSTKWKKVHKMTVFSHQISYNLMTLLSLKTFSICLVIILFRILWSTFGWATLACRSVGWITICVPSPNSVLFVDFSSLECWSHRITYPKKPYIV